MPTVKNSNSLLATLASLLIVYISVVSVNLIKPAPSYKPQTLGDETTNAAIIIPSPTPIAPIIVEFANTKLMTNSQTLYETDVVIKTTALASVGFWFQGPNNPYGTSVVEDKTVPLKKDHTFHISALPIGTYEYFATSFDNQNQKPPYQKLPNSGTKLMYIGTLPPSPTPSLAPISNLPYIPNAN